MADRRGGRIVNPSDIDALINQGNSSQQRRQEPIDRRKREADEQQKIEDMKKLAEDTGTISQQKRGKGI
jgi:hypothetical protein